MLLKSFGGEMRVVDYIAQRLAAAGISRVFLVQGSANNDIIYQIADTTGIEYTCCLHEQACGFAAEGWSKTTGKPGCCVVTSGPGGQNLVTPIANFYYDSVPGIFITGQVNSRFMRKTDELRQLGFQEWPAAEVMRPITKRAVCITDPKRVPDELEIALELCQHGRPGPVLLDIPIDVQRAELTSWETTRARPTGSIHRVHEERLALVTNQSLHARSHTITQFLDDFWKAERPVIMIGGGVRSPKAVDAFDRMADALQIPVFPTWNALDVVSSDHPWYGGRVGTYGGPGRNFGVQNSDLLLTIGCRLSGRITGGVPSTFARGAKRYCVDIDPGLLNHRNQDQPFHINCYSDATEFMTQLRMAYYHRLCSLAGLPTPPPDRTLWMERVRTWKNKYNPVLEAKFAPGQNPLHPYEFAYQLSQQLQNNAIIVTDCGGNVVVMNHAFETKRGQRYFSNNGNSPMGFSFAAAIGAWLAAPERPVICVIGDGGFQINIQELQTMHYYQAKIKVFIMNNHIYGITQQFQKNHYPDRGPQASGPPGPGYSTPNFVRVVKGYKIEVRQIVGADLATEICSVLEFNGPVVCDVDCGQFCSYAPRIEGWATPIEDMTPYLPREEFRKNMIVDPLPRWESNQYEENK